MDKLHVVATGGKGGDGCVSLEGEKNTNCVLPQQALLLLLNSSYWYQVRVPGIEFYTPENHHAHYARGLPGPALQQSYVSTKWITGITC